jgi:hypothetical protein
MTGFEKTGILRLLFIPFRSQQITFLQNNVPDPSSSLFAILIIPFGSTMHLLTLFGKQIKLKNCQENKLY